MEIHGNSWKLMEILEYPGIFGTVVVRVISRSTHVEHVIQSMSPHRVLWSV